MATTEIRMKITKKELKKIRNMIADIICYIDDIMNENDESKLGEVINNAYSDLDSAMGTLDNEL